MSNIFNFKRFGNYFLYDLRNAKNSYGVTFLASGLALVIAFVLVQSYSLLFSRHFADMSSSVWQWAAVVVAFCIVSLSAAARIYGGVTNKRSGAGFILLPASTFEKTLSLCLILLVVLPALLFAMLFASDLLLSLCFPSLYGGRVFTGFSSDVDGVRVNYFALLYFSWIITVLLFCLGSLIFKRAKVAKTLLCSFAISFVLEVIFFLSVANGDYSLDLDQIEPGKLFHFMNVFLNTYFFGVTALLLAGIYCRLKTIKL